MQKLDWPYRTITTAFKEGNEASFETTERVFDDQLGCVPPRRQWAGGFAVGEEYTETSRGVVHAVFQEVDGRFFCRHMHLVDVKPHVILEEIRTQLAFAASNASH